MFLAIEPAMLPVSPRKANQPGWKRMTARGGGSIGGGAAAPKLLHIMRLRDGFMSAHRLPNE